MTTGYPDWGGSAPLSQAITSISVSDQAIAPGGVKSFEGMITRQGYEIQLILSNATTGSVFTPVKIQMIWQEATNGAAINQQVWWVSSGDETGAHTIVGRGPSGGNQLTVTITNASALAPSLNASVLVLDVGRPYAIHDWRTRDDLGPVYPGFTAAVSDIAAGLLASCNGISTGPVGLTQLMMPLYTGRLQIKQFASPGGGVDLVLATAASSVTNENGGCVEGKSASGVPLMTLGYLPRIQSLIQLKNSAATATITTFAYVVTLP